VSASEYTLMLFRRSSAFCWVGLGLVVVGHVSPVAGWVQVLRVMVARCSKRPLKVRAGEPSGRLLVHPLLAAAGDLSAGATGSRSSACDHPAARAGHSQRDIATELVTLMRLAFADAIHAWFAQAVPLALSVRFC